MKVLIISDIHGNYEALKAVMELESYDQLVFLGDAVDYGPQPAEVVDFLHENSTFNLMGNHDYAVAYNEDCKCSPLMHDLSVFSREEISNKLLGPTDLQKIKEFKTHIETEIGGLKIYMAHASPYNNMYGYLFSTEAEMVSRDKKLADFSYIMVGHTHFPMFYKGRILNPGSAGQPREGFWKPWYSVLETEETRVEFKRFRYDNQKVINQLKELIDTENPHFKELVKFYSS